MNPLASSKYINRQGFIPLLAKTINPAANRFRARALPEDDTNSKDNVDLLQQARALDRLFYQAQTTVTDTDSTHPEVIESLDNHSQPSEAIAGEGGRINDLALWRVQWAMLPGYQEVLHVHVPHYVDAFSRLFQMPRPWRFGHLLLPGGSANLNDPEYALVPGTNAPLVGTLMEVLQAVNFPDGRLLILAAGVGKFRVLQATQTIPHSRADVMLISDPEEVAAFKNMAADGLDACGDDIPMDAALSAVTKAAEAAAIEYSKAWWNYELCLSRVHEKLALIDATDESIAQEFGRRLISIGSNQVLSLPFASNEGLEEPIDEMKFTAERAAADAVSQVLESLTGIRPSNSSSNADNDDNSGLTGNATSLLLNNMADGITTSSSGLNTIQERGIASVSASEMAGAGSTLEQDMNLPDTLESALVLEQRIWSELEAIADLSKMLSNKELILPDGLLCLIPPKSSGDNESRKRVQRRTSGEAYERIAAKYPTLRRLHKLSFAMFHVLPDSDVSEARQAWLESGSIAGRLKLAVASLSYQHKVLAAVAAVEKLKREEGSNDSSTDESD